MQDCIARSYEAALPQEKMMNTKDVTVGHTIPGKLILQLQAWVRVQVNFCPLFSIKKCSVGCDESLYSIHPVQQ
jgi:hypothetical protein